MASVDSEENQVALLGRAVDAQPAVGAGSGLAEAARRARPQGFKSRHLGLPVARKLQGAGAAEYALQEMKLQQIKKQAEVGAEGDAVIPQPDQHEDWEADAKEQTLKERNEEIHQSHSLPLQELLEAKTIDYFKKVMTGPEFSGLQHEYTFDLNKVGEQIVQSKNTGGSITSALSQNRSSEAVESKRLKCVQVEPIRIHGVLYFVVTAVDEHQDGLTGFLELIILKYQPITRKKTDAPITKIWQKRLNKEPTPLCIRNSSLWVQNANMIHYFDVENDQKGKQIVCHSNAFDLLTEKESAGKVQKIKMATNQQNELLEGTCIIFAKQGLAQEEMNLNEHAEVEKVFMKSQVVMLIARSRKQRQIVCSMRKVAELETVLTSETVELPEDEAEGQSGTSPGIQVNFLYVDRQLPAQKQLQLKTDFIALNLVVGQESVSETIWSVDVVDHKTSYNKLDIANMPYSEQELLNQAKQLIQKKLQLLKDATFSRYDNKVNKKDHTRAILAKHSIPPTSFYPQLIKSIFLFDDTNLSQLSSFNLMYDKLKERCVFIVNQGGVLKIKESQLNTKRMIEKINLKNMNGFAVAANKIKFGQQLTQAYDNLYVQIDHQAQQGKNKVKILYIDAKQKVTEIGDESNLILDMDLGLVGDARIQNQQQQAHGEIHQNQYMYSFGLENKCECKLKHNINLNEQSATRRIQIASEVSHIRPRIQLHAHTQLEKDKEIITQQALFLEMYDHKTSQVLFKLAVQAFESERKDNYNLQSFVESSEVYPGSESSESFCQNWQWCSISQNKRICHVLEFKVTWSESCPTTAYVECPTQQNINNQLNKAELLGIKMLILSKEYPYERNYLYSMYDENNRIIGTQWVEDLFNLSMPNFSKRDYQSRTNVAHSGFKRYYKANSEKPFAILVEAQLGEQLQANGEMFSYAEKFAILNQQARTQLNIVPNEFETLIQTPLEQLDILDYDFFSPLELLNGQSLADYFLTRPDTISQVISTCTDFDQEQAVKDQIANQKPSIIQKFIQAHEDEPFLKSLTKEGYIRAKLEVTKDPFGSNCIQRCFDCDPQQIETVKILIAEVLGRESVFQEYEIFMELLPYILQAQDSMTCFNIFFTDFTGENDYDDVAQSLCFSWHLQSNKLPVYSDNRQVMKQFETDKDIPVLLSQHQGYMHTQFIKDIDSKSKKKTIGKNSIKIEHFAVDTRSMHTSGKLSQNIQQMHLEDISITNKPMTDFDLSQLIYDINRKYKNSIEDQVSIRNIIDIQFQQTKVGYLGLSICYLLGFLVPFWLQMFVFNEPEEDATNKLFPNAFQADSEKDRYKDQNLTCLTICLLTLIALNGLQFMKLYLIGWQEYYRRPPKQDWFDLVMLIIYIVYFCIRMVHPTVVLASDWSKRPEIHDNLTLNGLSVILVLNIVLISMSILKFMTYMAIFDAFGQLVNLLLYVFIDILPFTFFFFFWVVVFGELYQIVGVQIENDKDSDYPQMNANFVFAITSYRNSISDIQVPKYPFWTKVTKLEQGAAYGYFMIACIWCIWLVNQFFITIILLNFLIAIIVQSYESVMSKSIINIYSTKAAWNRDYRIIKSYLQDKVFQRISTTLFPRKPFEVFLLSAQTFTEQHSSEDWTGFVKTIKNTLRNEARLLREKVPSMIRETNGDTRSKMNKCAQMKIWSGETKISSELERVKGEILEVNGLVRQILANPQKQLNFKLLNAPRDSH